MPSHLNKARKRQRQRNHTYNRVMSQANFFHSTVAALFQKDQDRCATHSSHDAGDGKEHASLLTELPPEIRVLIYSYVLARQTQITLSKRELLVHKGIGPPLLRVSVAIRNEALPVYFSLNEFQLRTRLRDFSRVARWMNMLLERRSLTCFRHLSFLVSDGDFRWKDLSRILPLVQLYAKGLLKPDIQLIEQRETPRRSQVAKACSLFEMAPREVSGYVQLALEEAVLLADQARREGWSAEQVAVEFQRLGLEDGRAGSWWVRRRRRLKENAPRKVLDGDNDNLEVRTTDRG